MNLRAAHSGPGIGGLVFALAMLALPGHGIAAERQDPAQMLQSAERFLKIQTAGLPGKVSVSVNKPDSRTNLPACAALEAFQPKGSRIWGRTTVGIKCLAPSAWTVYLSATIHVIGEYVTTAAALKQGQVIEHDNLLVRTADLGELPIDVITDPAEAIGYSTISGLAPGAPLRRDLLRAPRVVQQGQSTRLVLSGPGFSIGSEGKALANASVGQVVQVRTQAGQVVSGIALAGQIVDVPFQ